MKLIFIYFYESKGKPVPENIKEESKGLATTGKKIFFRLCRIL